MRFASLPLAVLVIASAARADESVEFNRDVRPILSDACFACHGIDAKARKGKLRLDVPEGAFAIRDGEAAIKPGDPKASTLWARITTDDKDEVMPPPHSNKKLTAVQKATLRKWIEHGAKYQKHWSFEPVTRPAVPMGARTPIDSFLLPAMTKVGLTPRTEANKATLIRRVAFALTGLPPTPGELDEFLKDTLPTAYEKMVDRYLASPRYGEEMARNWLDIARYADTHGLHLDNERQMWGYRDWVVKAFNENLSFDKFTVWQIAGDLLPKPTPDQLAATGFNRCNVTTGEGGSIDAEWVYRNAVDRTSTMTSAWLGLTAGCAVCHDHKFDPISAKEYYSLYSFFLSAADPALDGNLSIVGPFEKLPTEAQQAALETAKKAEAEARKQFDEAAAKVDYQDPADQEPLPKNQPVREELFDDNFPHWATSRNTSRNAADWVTDPAFGAKSGRRVLRQANSFFHEDAVTFKVRPLAMPINGSFEVWVRVDADQPPGAIAIQLSGSKKLWWGKEPKEGSTYAARVGGTRLGDLPAAGTWVKLSVSAKELGLNPGHGISSLTLQEYGGLVFWDAAALVGETAPGADPLASFAVWKKSLGAKPPAEVPADATKWKAFYLSNIVRPVNEESAKRQAAWKKAEIDRIAADDAIPGTLIFRDMGMPREAFVMQRGQYDKAGEKVQPGVPAVLPPLKLSNDKARPTRLDLANWLVAPENPLVARVAVNRLWQQFFGVGLVKTSADFGSQGEPPSHPELLDWLAAEYRDGGWDTKKLVKTMLLSDAFRRESKQTAEARAIDPENRLLARGPRFRLDAEQLRDNALYVSGLMNLQVGGRGVNTYQPPNIWEPVGYGDSNTRYYLQDHGPAIYRRSLYVFIKRTAPHPFLTNFDATNREQLCAVRDRTNTPLQALQLMNDVQHFESARALAERVLVEGGKTTPERVAFLYRVVLSRLPDKDELRIVSEALAKQQELYKADSAAAKKVVEVGESKPRYVSTDVDTASWTMIANLILNLDETVMRN